MDRRKVKKKQLKKKPLFFLFGLLVVGIIGATFAYYYSEVVIPSEFKAMNYDVKIEEEFYGKFGTKKVSFVNNNEEGVPVLLRMNYNESWIKTIEEDGEIIEIFKPTLYYDQDSNQRLSVEKQWTENFEEDFIYNEDDGWYYYKKVLNPKESVQILDSITQSSDLPNTYAEYKYRLIFNMEAIQAKETEAQLRWSMDMTLDGGGIDWAVNTVESSV